MSLSDGDAIAPPPKALALLVWTGPLLALATLGFSLRYVLEWSSDRAGRTVLEQRLSLIGVPFFKPAFVEFVERALRTIPEDARVLVEPRAVELEDGSRVWDPRGQARWYLYLNYYLYPRQVYVRQPELASGTLVDYPRWLEHHFVTLEQDGSEEWAEREARAIAAHGIDWRVSYPATKRFQIERATVERAVDGDWEAVELAPLPADSPVRARRGGAGSDDDEEERGS